MTLQNAASGNNLIARIPIVGTFSNTNNTPQFNNGQFNPGTGSSGSTAIWGNITGTLSNQTDLQNALNNKQNTISTGSTNQYLRGDLSLSTFNNDVRAATLTGFDATVTLADINSSDSVLGAFNKTQRQLDDLDTRLLALNPSNSSFTNGGDNATNRRILGNNTNHGLDIETNNITGLSIEANGSINIWDSTGSRYAASNNFMARGSLTIGDLNKNFGGGQNWNSNTAALLLECNDNTETAIHDSGTRLSSSFYYEGSPNRYTFGRNMGWGITNQHHFLDRSFIISHQTNFNYNNLNIPIDENGRSNLIIGGLYPHIHLISNQTGNGNHSNGLSFAELLQGNSTTARQWHFGQASYGKYFHIGYIESSDFNPHNGINNWGNTTLISIVAPGQSTNLGSRAGISLNGRFDPEYHLDLNEGSIGWGTNNSRTETTDSLNRSNTIAYKQSGFFETTGTVTGLPTGYNSSQVFHLISCGRGTNPTMALQIAGWDIDNKFWVRKTGHSSNWHEMLVRYSDNSSNGWHINGNASVDSNTQFIGTATDADLLLKRNNETRIRMFNDRTEFYQGSTERFRIRAQNQILVNTNAALNTPSTPHYAFNGNAGEDDGMYLIANDILGFATAGVERLRVEANRIKATTGIESNDGFYVNNNKVINSKSSTTISNLGGGASLNDVINSYNTLLSVLRDHHDLFN